MSGLNPSIRGMLGTSSSATARLPVAPATPNGTGGVLQCVRENNNGKYGSNFKFNIFLYNKDQHNFRNIVFLDIRKANFIFVVCLFCIFIINTIYVV